MAQAFGLYTHQRNNRIRSNLLIAFEAIECNTIIDRNSLDTNFFVFFLL